ncbi:MAG TPA: hypothetical protein VEH28_00405 [Thermoplasmata archaeon]|nr:hypothetical protein [Thermoplasmata archaeon]
MATGVPPSSEEYDQVDWSDVLNEKRIDILLSRQQMIDVLRKLGHEIDDEGYVLDRVSHERIISIDGGEIKGEEVAAALPGSEVLLKKNIASFSQYLSEHGL